MVPEFQTRGSEAECNERIRQALEHARQLTILADEGELCCRDDGCAVLFGVIRDCAYRIRAQAESERDSHKMQGRWHAGTERGSAEEAGGRSTRRPCAGTCGGAQGEPGAPPDRPTS
jgi:hypothetical protein